MSVLSRRDLLILVTVALGVFFAADDQTSVVTILPAMVPDIGIEIQNVHEALWVINAYLIGFVVTMPIAGRLADIYGYERVFTFALVIFMAGSAFVALSTDLVPLLLARVVQAFGGGAVVPAAMAIVVGILPANRRTLGLGLIAAASAIGALLGPVWGGGITELLSWQWVFWLNIPMTFPILVVSFFLIRGRSIQIKAHVDWIGAALLVSILTLLVFTITDNSLDRRPHWITGSLYGFSLILVCLFVWWENRVTEPLVRLTMFRLRAVWTSFLATFFSGFGLIVALYAIPFFIFLLVGDFSDQNSSTALDGGLVLMRFVAATPIGALTGGWIAQRIGLRITASAGMLLGCVGFLGLAGWDIEINEFTRTLPLVLGGFGFGLIIAPLGSAVLQAVSDSERATAAGWLNLSRIIGMVIGAAVVGSLFIDRFLNQLLAEAADSSLSVAVASIPNFGVSSFQLIFLVAAGVTACGFVTTLFIGKSEGSDEQGSWWAPL